MGVRMTTDEEMEASKRREAECKGKNEEEIGKLLFSLNSEFEEVEKRSPLFDTKKLVSNLDWMERVAKDLLKAVRKYKKDIRKNGYE
jgi:hypothetical protein